MSDAPQGPGWWLASNGKWYPPSLQPPPPPTGAPKRTAWGRFRSLPAWAQVATWIGVALLVFGVVGAAVGSPDEQEPEVTAAAVTTERERATTSEPATTTEAPTTTEPPTTTTQGPTTTTNLEALRQVVEAGIAEDCAAAVAAPLGDIDYARYITSYQARWGVVATRDEYTYFVAECARPQRDARLEGECTTTPPVEAIHRDPDAHMLSCVTIFVQVVQFDQATGPCGFRGYWDATAHEYSFDYKGENGFFSAAEPCPMLDSVGVDDIIRVRAVVIGGIDYETTIGGTAHAVGFSVLTAEMVSDQ